MARRAAAVFAVILLATVAADQGSKAWAHTLPVHPAGCVLPEQMLAARCIGVPRPVVDGYWDWELAYNPGVAFSRFASFTGHGGMQVILSLIAVLALIGITALALRTSPGERGKRIGYALVAGGALGNLVDRLHDGAVTDFVRWRIHDHRWPIFNLADAALLIGVVLLVIGGSDRGAARRPPEPEHRRRFAEARWPRGVVRVTDRNSRAPSRGRMIGRMKRAVLAILLAGCQASADDYPTRPNGGGTVIVGGGGGGTGGDAGVGDGGDGGISVVAQVCLVTDLRKLTACSPTGAKGLQVALGSGPKLTVTTDDGHFTFDAPTSTDLVWHVTSTTLDRIVTSAMRYGTDHTIPVISTTAYTDLRNIVAAPLPADQQGSVVVRVVRGTSPVAGVAATTTLSQNNSVFYDGDPRLANNWVTTGTGANGVVWFPGLSLTPSTGSVALTPLGGTSVPVPATVENDTITFVTKDIP